MVNIHTMDKVKILLSDQFLKDIDYLIYKSRHLILYILFGFISIIFEFIIKLILLVFTSNVLLNLFFPASMGILLMYFLNIKFNFNIPKKKRIRSFFYFFIISYFSLILQEILNSNHSLFKAIISNSLIQFDNYFIIRLSILFILFSLGYLLHTRISFKDFKRVGVAIYANGVQPVQSIYDKINQYPDFIHVDIVDKTIVDGASENKIYTFEIIKAFWKNKKIETHIMSKEPNRWIDQAVLYSDIIYLHFDMDKNFLKSVKKIKNKNVIAGLAVHCKTNFEDFKNLIPDFKNLLILSIDEPGHSGQDFQEQTLDLIEKINKINQNINICVDGGVNIKNISKINSKSVVSGSEVLNSVNPRKKIMSLQTVSRFLY
jgi:ribulose-phosphate 3-epimerase